MVVRDFVRNKDSFVTVAEYIESLEWEKQGMHQGSSEQYSFGFAAYKDVDVNIYYPRGVTDVTIPEVDEDVKQAVRLLFKNLGYSRVERTTISGNTIIFIVKDPVFEWHYYNQGVCYVMDGGEPTPEVNLDYYTEYLEPLGDNWYYWNGHCYFP